MSKRVQFFFYFFCDLFRILWHAYIALMVCECLFLSCIVYTMCVPAVNVSDSSGEQFTISLTH